jgi:hypothetical protein
MLRNITMGLFIIAPGQVPGQNFAFDNALAIALLAGIAEPVFAAARICFGTSPIQAEKYRPDRDAFGSAMRATRAVSSTGLTPGTSSSRLHESGSKRS